MPPVEREREEHLPAAEDSLDHPADHHIADGRGGPDVPAVAMVRGGQTWPETIYIATPRTLSANARALSHRVLSGRTITSRSMYCTTPATVATSAPSRLKNVPCP